MGGVAVEMSCGLSGQLSLCLKVKSKVPDLEWESIDILPLCNSESAQRMTLGKQMSQRRTKPRVTMEGLGVAGSRKSGMHVCACMCLGFSYPNRDIKNHSTWGS